MFSYFYHKFHPFCLFAPFCLSSSHSSACSSMHALFSKRPLCSAMSLNGLSAYRADAVIAIIRAETYQIWNKTKINLVILHVWVLFIDFDDLCMILHPKCHHGASSCPCPGVYLLISGPKENSLEARAHPCTTVQTFWLLMFIISRPFIFSEDYYRTSESSQHVHGTIVNM